MLKRVLQVIGLVAAGLLIGVALHTAVSALTNGDSMFAGRRPGNLGVTEGRLAPPRSTPNCVSSQADPKDVQHAIAALRYTGSADVAMGALRGVLDGMPGAVVIRQDPTYLYAEFRSRLMGFVDDVEFSLSEKDGVIHMRSASRLGRRDYGVNRARMEVIRARFQAISGKAVRS